VLKPMIANPPAVNAKLKLLWISWGKQDFLRAADQELAKTLTDAGIKITSQEREGAHVWSVWRNNLNDAAPLLFTAARH